MYDKFSKLFVCLILYTVQFVSTVSTVLLLLYTCTKLKPVTRLGKTVLVHGKYAALY